MSNVTWLGWVDPPDGRGTFDILWTCLATTFLCCWTTVYANVPEEDAGEWRIFRDRLGMFSLALIGPDFLLAMAYGQWRSAHRSVKAFHKEGCKDWSLRHAFFADMGGLVLNASDCSPFPVDAKQLHYLVKHGFVDFPKIKKHEIDDKNKSDTLSRILAILQMSWFLTNSIARLVQGLGITTMELTTLGFVYCTFGTSCFWKHKPSDIRTGMRLKANTEISSILLQAGELAQHPYHDTPLDFINGREWIVERLWRQYNGMLSAMGISIFRREVKKRPVDRLLPKFTRIPIYFHAIMAGYCVIFILGWRFDFPSRTELILWRVAVIAAFVSTVAADLIQEYYSGTFRKLTYRKLDGGGLAKQEDPEVVPLSARDSAGPLARSAMQVKLRGWKRNMGDNHYLEIPWRSFLLITPMFAIYMICRLYILVDDVVALRSQPPNIYQSVKWSRYLPHIS